MTFQQTLKQFTVGGISAVSSVDRPYTLSDGTPVIITQHKPKLITNQGKLPTNPKKYRGPDDNFYKLDGAQDALPRSASTIKVEGVEFPFVGMVKFTGDEDGPGLSPGNVIPNLLQPEKKELATHAVRTQKVNGKFFMIGTHQLSGDRLMLIICSKGVHVPLLFTDRYRYQPEEKLIGDMLNAFNSIYDALTPENQTRVDELLLQDNLLGEYQDWKHIVPKHQKDSPIKFFAVSSRQPRSPGDSLSGDIYANLQKLESMGLPVTEYELISLTDYTESKHSLTPTDDFSEGEVIHFVSQKPDKSFHTHIIIKKKDPRYVLLRAIRQLLIGKKSWEENLQSTLELKNTFLHLAPEILVQWQQTLEVFCEWFSNHPKLTTKHINTALPQNIGFGNVWKQFFEQYNPIPLTPLTSTTEPTSRASRGLLVVYSGVPGIGKSTLAPNPHERDQFRGQPKANYQKTLDKRLRSQEPEVHATSNNSMPREYLPAIRTARAAGRAIVRIVPAEFSSGNSNRQGLLWVAIHSVLNRENHPNYPTDPIEAYRVLMGFVSRFQNDYQNFDYVLEVPYLQTDLPEEPIPEFPDPETASPEELHAFLTEARNSTFSQKARRSIGEMQLDIHSRLEALEPVTIISPSCPVKSIQKFDYYKVSLPMAKKELLPFLPKIEKQQKLYCSHVTIVTNNTPSFPQDPDWKGKKVTVEATGYIHIPESLALVVKVRLLDTEHNDISHLVNSGLPHITVALKKREAPVKSQDYLRTAMPEQEFEFAQPILMQSHIMLHSERSK